MSEIREYRGKRIEDGKWIFGGFHKHQNRTLCVIGDELKDEDIDYLIIQSGFSDWNMPKPIECYKVDPSTVGQYSGKDDKNSVRIFEDDIVKLGNNPIHNGVLVRCIYADWRCGFVYEFLTGKNKGKFTDMNDSWRDYERIGNIHDNPELLEVEE